jgi:hypothetical protein
MATEREPPNVGKIRIQSNVQAILAANPLPQCGIGHPGQTFVMDTVGFIARIPKKLGVAAPKILVQFDAERH